MASGRRLFLLALIASLCITAALAIGTLLFAEFDDIAVRILLTTTFLSVASLLALPAGVLLDKRRAPMLAGTVIVSAAAGFAFAMVAVWAGPDEAWVWKLALSLGLAAGAGAQAAASTARRRPEDGRALLWLYVSAVVLTTALASMIAIAAWGEIDGARSYYRFLGATAVAAVLATLLQPIIRRTQGPGLPQHELVLRLDKAPSEEAVAAAVEALEQHGLRAERV